MTGPRILVVDDEAPMRRMLRRGLEADGFEVLEAQDRKTVDQRMSKPGVDLVTLDINLGGESGFDLLRHIRGLGTPVIVLSGRSDLVDRVAGLESGADDYITKPFHVRELAARIRTVLRRAQAGPADARDEAALYAFGDMFADPARLELRMRGGDGILLTPGDFRLLRVFLDAPGRVLSRDAIMDRMHGRSWFPSSRAIDNHIARLRRKIEVDPKKPALIRTVRGMGYVFAAEVRRLSSLAPM